MLALVPGELYPYRLFVNGDSPVDLSIGPGGNSAPLLRGPLDEMSLALWLDGIGGTFDGCSLGGVGNMAVPTLNVTWDDPGDGSHDGAPGGICLHGGTEAIFTPTLRPAGIHDRWLFEGLSERDGKLVLAVPDIGVVHYGSATLFTDKLRFGVVQSVVSAHRCDNCNSSPYCSVCNCYVPLDLSLDFRSPLTLKHDSQTTISIVHANSIGETHDNGIIFIRRKGDLEWLALGSENSLNPWMAKVAGIFELKGQATVNGQDWITPIVEIEVRFPSYDDITGDDMVISAMNAAWQMTKDSCTETPNERYEFGFWIQLNTYSNDYVIGSIEKGPPSSPGTNGHLRLSGRPPDLPSCPNANATGARYTVGMFHTHSPRTYLTPTNGFRRVGPSERDYRGATLRQLVGVVYDYVGVPDSNGNPTNRLYNGHSKDDPARLYSIPPYRRPTPWSEIE